MMLSLLAAAALVALPAVASAQDQQAATGQPPQRIRDVTVTRTQRCPTSTATEVVVCHRLDEPYRIPKALRDTGPIPAANQAWANRTETMDQVGRVNGGVPDSCSAVGIAGQSGCWQALNQQYAADRRARRDEQQGEASVVASERTTPGGTGQ